MTGPRSRDVSAFPGAPGVSGGVPSPTPPPIRSGVVGNNDFLEGGAETVTTGQAFPGYDGQTWQALAPDEDAINESTVTDPGHVSGGIRTSSPEAFPGGGQGV